MGVLVLEAGAYSASALATYRSLGPVYLEDAPDPETVTVLVVRLAHKIDALLLSRFPALRVVVSPTTGLDHIDETACADRGIDVFSLRSTPEALERVTSTSELTLGLMLAVVRRIPQANHDVIENGNWQRDRFRGRQVAGLTLGIVGLGRIGRHVAGYARALGMTLVATEPHWPQTGFDDVKRVSLPELLATSDIVSLHVKHTPQTHKLIGAEQIQAMKPGACLVNTARGEVLDEQAAAQALRAGQLGGIAVDVLADENAVVDNLSLSPLVAAAQAGLNVLVTPHIGGCSQDAMHVTEEVMARYCADQMAKRNSMIG